MYRSRLGNDLSDITLDYVSSIDDDSDLSLGSIGVTDTFWRDWLRGFDWFFLTSSMITDYFKVTITLNS